ncbi:MAG: DUF4388 domain-containing protein [Gemmatimonadetes bacterium]|nr:MAG: DUF4388 domain-containing protein [Gemmatimonadota bacterium]
MAIEGSIADVSLADICQLLAMGRKTGCLAITDRSNFGYIYFDNGRVVYASVVNRPDRLGELLVKNDVITREHLSQAMERQAHEKGKRLGEILVEMGAVSQDDLDRYISLQIEEAVYHLFAWTQGSFHFNPDQRPDDNVFLVSINADALLMEGARRVDEWSLIEKKIPSMDLVFALERDPREEEGVELSEHQRRLIPLIDGTRSVEDLVHESGLVEFDTGKALYGLIQGGFAVQVGRRSSEDEGATAARIEEHLNLGRAFYRSGMIEDAAREFRKALEVDPKQPEARRRLGLLSLRAGRAQEALVHFDEMAQNGDPSYAVLRNRALALERMGRFQEAIDALDEAALLRADDPEVLLARGIVQFKAGDGAGARQTLAAYRKALGDTTPPPMFYAYAVLAAGIDGAFDEALALGREGLEHYPEDGRILVNTGAVIEQTGERTAAVAYYERAVKSPTAPPQAHKALGDVAFEAGDAATARKHYEAAIALDPRLGEDVYVKLGMLAFQEADKKQAGVLWRRALDINPENAEVQAHLERLEAPAGG